MPNSVYAGNCRSQSDRQYVVVDRRGEDCLSESMIESRPTRLYIGSYAKSLKCGAYVNLDLEVGEHV